MSTTTSNLGLFKYDVNTDTNVAFSITKALNNNWDIIDEKCNGGGLEVCDIGMALYVDETKGLRRYLNGQIVDINTNTQAFLNRLKQITILHPSLLCTEQEWQSAKTLSAFGQVGKFVFNYSGDEIVSVRLPRVVNVQGLFDLQNLGMTVKESLPNITGGFTGFGDEGTRGSFISKRATDTYHRVPGGSSQWKNNITFNASLSSSTYQDNAPVQQEAIQYPYFIQIATGSETENNIVNTLENVNGFTLLESKYSDKPLYNESWLLSNGQWNAKAVYPTAYEALQVEHNTEIEAGTTVTLPSGISYTKRGLSVKLSTETYTDYDFVLNTAEETFRLPLKTKLASGNAVVGNGMTLGLMSSGKGRFGLYNASDANNSVASGIYGAPIGTTPTNSVTRPTASYGVTDDPTKSGIELSDSGLYLYFYVGDIDQNHGIVNMGRIAEQLANLITVVETYQNGASWYRVWSDGWCEQGGYTSSTNTDTAIIALLKQYKETNYSVSLTGYGSSSSAVGATFYPIDNSSFYVRSNASSTNWLRIYWQASGYIR